MDLRPHSTRASLQQPLLSGLGVAAFALGAVLLSFFVPRAHAAVSDYPATLYLSGTTSGIGSSFKLVGSAGISSNARPAPAAASNGAGLLGSAGLTSYTYEYTLVDANGETAPSTKSNTVSVNNGQIRVSNLPTGVTVRLYRQKGVNAPFLRVVELANNASATYDDNNPDPLATVVPLAQNRTDLNGSGGGGITGYFEYAPGNSITDSATNGSFAQVAAPSFDGRGWLVGAPGSVSFATGAWSVRVKVASTGSALSTAHLVVGLWKVNDSGTVTGGPYIDPTCTAAPCGSGGAPGENTSANISTAAGTAAAITTNFANVPAISLAANEHLYVQFWRRQTAGTTGNSISTLNAYDGTNWITHPAANGFPNDPTLQSPVGGVRTGSKTLTAAYSDPDADTGTVDFRVCSDAACSSVVASTSVASVASGSSPTWTPALVDGTYYWKAHATDSAGNQSAWTSTQAFTLDTVNPTAALQSPADATLTNAQPSLVAAYADGGAGDAGTVDLRVCSDAACSSVVTSTSVAGVADGANATWAPTLADGAYVWQARSTDGAGNQSAWTAARSFTLDTTAPVATLDTTPASLAASSAASFAFQSEPGAVLRCSLDGAGFAVCASPKSYAALADGSHTFQLQATDAAGNVGSASFTWTVDTVAPTTTISSQPAALTSSSAASISFGSSDAGATFQCKLDAGAWAACTSPAAYTGLGDGAHTFQVEGTDAAGNTGTAASASWTSDATAPSVPSLISPTGGARTNGRTLVARASDGSGQAKILFRICADAACGSALDAWVSPLSSSGSNVSWTPGAVTDGSYFWQALAADAAGNQSSWSSTEGFTLDTTPPAAPTGFTGTVTGRDLTLGWDPSAGGDPLASYVLYVDGTRSQSVGATTTRIDLGTPPSDTPRVYSVSAVDAAGNEGPRSATLVAVPNLVGLKLPEALAALAQRGLALGDRHGPPSGLVTAQSLAPPAVASPGTAVDVTTATPTPPTAAPHGPKPQPKSKSTRRVLSILIVGGRDVACTPDDRLGLQIGLSSRAAVTVRFLTLRGVPLATRRIGTVSAGSRVLRLELPEQVTRPGRYRVIVLASVRQQIVRAEMRFSFSKLERSSGAQATTCSTPGG